MIIPHSKIFALAIFGSFSLPILSVKAAVVTYQVDVNIDFGPLIGNSYTGKLTYDNLGLTGVGDESVLISSFNFPFEGKTYTQNDALSPTVDFTDGIFLGLNYSGDGPSFPTFSAGISGFFDPSFNYDLGGTGGAGTGALNYTPIPESSLVVGLLMVSGVTFVIKRYLTHP
jgi:hypothetical protein